MEPKPTVKLTSFHLAGIIPVAGHQCDFGFQWDNVLMPIAENVHTLVVKRYGSFVIRMFSH